MSNLLSKVNKVFLSLLVSASVIIPSKNVNNYKMNTYIMTADSVIQNLFEKKKKIKQNYKKKDVTLDHLVINLDDSIRTNSVMTKKEGLKDMRFLANKSSFEEAWCYDKNSQKWCEIGSFHIFPWAVRYDFDKVKEIAQNVSKGDILYTYHIHPTKESLDNYFSEINNISSELNWNYLGLNPFYFGNNFDNDSEQLNKKREFRSISLKEYEIKTKKILGKAFSDVIDACPSINDLTSLIRDSIILKKHFPNIVYKDIICSQYGLTEYNITSEGLNKYQKGKISQLLTKDYRISKTDGVIEIKDKYICIKFKRFEGGFNINWLDEKKMVFYNDLNYMKSFEFK